MDPQNLTEAQRWIRNDTTQTYLERHGREADDLLRRITAMDETWAMSYELQLNRQSNELSHVGHQAKQNKSSSNPY